MKFNFDDLREGDSVMMRDARGRNHEMVVVEKGSYYHHFPITVVNASSEDLYLAQDDMDLDYGEEPNQFIMAPGVRMSFKKDGFLAPVGGS